MLKKCRLLRTLIGLKISKYWTCQYIKIYYIKYFRYQLQTENKIHKLGLRDLSMASFYDISGRAEFTMICIGQFNRSNMNRANATADAAVMRKAMLNTGLDEFNVEFGDQREISKQEAIDHIQRLVSSGRIKLHQNYCHHFIAWLLWK